MKILLTGGTGYIGSHAAVELIQQGYDVSIIDNLSNSHANVVQRIEALSGTEPNFFLGDIRDVKFLDGVFDTIRPDLVIHFAGLKAVGESVKLPTLYYDVNVAGTVKLLSAMESYSCHKIIFSSSATVYGVCSNPPFVENSPTRPINPYGHSKILVEQILERWVSAHVLRQSIILRYFNPVGSHQSGLLGEDPNGIPNNIMPYIARVAKGDLKVLPIFGDDYETRDGTGERDYIHVMDLAVGHRLALDKIHTLGALEIFNLGTGGGTTVHELVTTYENVTSRKIPFVIKPRRDGDVASAWADTTKARSLLGFECVRSVTDMCRDSWAWECNKANEVNFS